MNSKLLNISLAPILLLFVFLFSANAFADATAVIKVNNLSTPQTVVGTDPASISISLDQGDQAGIFADWWLVRNTPLGWEHYALDGSWQQGLYPTYQGPIRNLANFEISASTPSFGRYTYYFGVDTMMNGQVDLDKLFFSWVPISYESTVPPLQKGVITPAQNNVDYVVFAWNDLGMHCANPSYDTAVILPPYNTVWAQVLKRGEPPQVVTTGLSVEYRVVNNSQSASKGLYWQFWQYCQQLFGVKLATDTGLNLEDPAIHNGLSGNMVAKGNHFQVNGIPVTPITDTGAWNPYQVIEVTVKNASGNVVAQTRTTLPVSDEINCAKCHNGNANPALDVLQKHDKNEGTNLVGKMPVLCASCHGSPVLGLTGRGSSGKYLSEAIHGFHVNKGATCYDCHPGAQTQCSRSLAHTAPDGKCTTCHGSMAAMAQSIANNTKVPWMTEPKCVSCHSGVAEVDTGNTLFRNAVGHGGVYCAGCHGSPHAMVPSRVDIDNYQSLQYQNYAKSIGSCGACHASSKGEGLGEYLEAHGSGRHPNSCYVCHTATPVTNTAKWPHQFQWKDRTGSGYVSDD